MNNNHEKIARSFDVVNEIEFAWDDLVRRSFPARYAGHDVLGGKINIGDAIARLTCGGYVLIHNK